MSVQQSTLLNRRRIRRTFGKINEVAQMPNLIEVQRNSYEQFLQMYDPIDERVNAGLQAVFSSVFPIKDFVGRSMLEFVSYTLEEPKYDVDECHQRGLTYSSPLRLTLRSCGKLFGASIGRPAGTHRDAGPAAGKASTQRSRRHSCRLSSSVTVRGTCPMLGGVLMLACLNRNFPSCIGEIGEDAFEWVGDHNKPPHSLPDVTSSNTRYTCEDDPSMGTGRCDMVSP